MSKKKLTKNHPIKNEDLEEFVKLYVTRKETDHSWVVKVGDIKGYDLSAKNLKSEVGVEHESPRKLLQNIRQNSSKIDELLNSIETILNE